MQTIVELAPAKVNLALHVLGRRVDGYHELSSIVAFADVADRLEISLAEENRLEVTGPFAADVPPGADNIILKAQAHLATLFSVPNLHVRLEKNLPVASGLGGGSADAAALIRGVLQLTGHQLSADEKMNLSRALGADVPVCLEGHACLMEGIGEKISTLTIPRPAALVLANPLAPCATAAVFSHMGLAPGAAFHGGTELWRNDMTAAALTVQPVIGAVLAALRATRLSRVLMSGSGATCFGVAQDFAEAEAVTTELRAAHPQWWIRAARVLP